MPSELIIAAFIASIVTIIATILKKKNLREPVFSYINKTISQILLIFILVLIFVVGFLCYKVHLLEVLRKEKEEIYEEKIAYFKEYISHEKDKYIDAQKKISALSTERDKLNEKINQSEKVLSRLNKELVEMRKKGAQVDYLEKQVIEKEKEIGLLKLERTNLSNELAMNKDELKNSKERFFKLEKDLAEVKQEIIEYMPESEVLKSKIDSLRNVIAGIKDEMLNPELSAPHIEGDSIVKELLSPKSGVEVARPRETRPPKLKLRLRDQPNYLTRDEMIKMLIQKDFFDVKWNNQGYGYDNKFEIIIIKNDTIISDHASGLMWQQGGSSEPMKYENVDKWIKELNQKGYAGYNDWRLPTLEEAMSLMEKERNNNGMYIDIIFNKKQISMWTSDLIEGGSCSWGVLFNFGYCGTTHLFIYDLYIRAARSG